MSSDLSSFNAASTQERNVLSKLAARSRNINILFIVFILVTMTVVCTIMIYSLTDSASRDYVRFYTTESIEILGSYLDRGTGGS